jgi:DNA-binding beta-propeller fold protein YncE
MVRPLVAKWTTVALFVSLSVASALTQRASVAHPGYTGGGVTLLPNGWRIAPAGVHLSIGDLPLAMAFTPDGRSIVVTNNGMARPTLRVVNLDRRVVAQTFALDDAWLGMAWHPNGTKFYSSGAAANSVVELRWQNGRLSAGSTIQLARSSRTPPNAAAELAPNAATPGPQSFVGGLAISPDGSRLCAVHVLGQLVNLIDTDARTIAATAKLPAEPYTCLASKDGKTFFVSLWGGAKVLMFDAATLAATGEIQVGEHPNAMVQSSDGARLFVACANTNSVWAIDLAAKKVTEQISIAISPNAPPGATPNSVAVSPDGRQLVVANADNNTVAVVDITASGSSRVNGFIPTGWYPTAAVFTPDGRNILILSGKGLTSLANPRGPQPGVPYADGQYTGSMLQGSLSIVPVPDAPTLQKYTKTVISLTPYTDATRLAPAGAPASSPIPGRVGGTSPIKHVFYVIRENRTYDQILGDLDRGNGDPNLALFGEEITPNAHAIARQFVTLDNFYVDAEVSYDGHAYSMAAYAADFVEKIWPTNYASRGAVYLSEGGGQTRNQYGNITAPANGYIWDAVLRAGKSVRSYGEFAREEGGSSPVTAAVPGLEGHVHPSYPPWNLKIPDNKRIDVWLEEFQQMDQAGTLPALSIVRLGNDHTQGTTAGASSPRAMIAENDLALGRFVEAITKSRSWKESAIFVLEDDAQNGPDHVDAHRSVALVVSPFVRRGVVDSTLYTTSGVLRTIELILGLPPMSQYDAAATPMYNAFQTTAVLTPFTKREARVPLDETNPSNAPGALASARMNFDEADRTPELELNEILWQAMHGPNAVMPAPVHAAFVRPMGGGDWDADDFFERIRPGSR